MNARARGIYERTTAPRATRIRFHSSPLRWFLHLCLLLSRTKHSLILQRRSLRVRECGWFGEMLRPTAPKARREKILIWTLGRSPPINPGGRNAQRKSLGPKWCYYFKRLHSVFWCASPKGNEKTDKKLRECFPRSSQVKKRLIVFTRLEFAAMSSLALRSHHCVFLFLSIWLLRFGGVL